jgi:hypothetical protein
MQLARAHYEALGFRVVELGFAERVIPRGARRGGKAGGDAGTLTFLSSLRRYMNAEAGRETGTGLPNLQAVLLWSDGRFAEEDVPGGWPARVYPVLAPVHSGEVQGEEAEADFAAPGGALLTVAWRALGKGPEAARAATLEIRDGKNSLWKTETSIPASSGGSRVVARFALPAALSGASADPSAWKLLVRPAGPARNSLLQNDTVPIRVRGRNRPLHLFLRPLASLEERGLVDALRAPQESSGASDAFGVVAVAPESLRVTRRDVVWVRAAAWGRLSQGARGRVAEAGVPLIAYALPVTAAAQGSRGAVFDADARLAWRADGAEFLPAGAVRLADLGAEALWLQAPNSSVEALAWAEQDGRRGVLFGRARNADGPVRFEFVAPPLWRAGFSAGARGGSGEEGKASATAARWTRGAGLWASLLAQGGRLRMSVPDPLFAGRAFAVSARGAKDEGTLQLTVPGMRVRAVSTGAGGMRFDVPGLAAGSHPASIGRGAAVLWSGVLRVADARAAELARLGIDAEALDPLAVRSEGRVINSLGNDFDNYEWPALSGGQARSSRARIVPLAPPFVSALVILALLSAVWAFRKRLRLD